MRIQLLVTIIFISLFTISRLEGQTQNTFRSITQISETIDTISLKVNHVRTHVTWLKDTIEIISLVRPVKYDIEFMQKLKKDSAFRPTDEERAYMISFLGTAAQNCYSNALERYFEYHQVESQSLFNYNNKLTREAFETIINSSFTKTFEFSTKKKKNFKMTVKDGSLIVFRNKSNWMNHAFFFENDVFYSKNGAWKLVEYDKMKDVFKKYWDTPIVEFYEMDKSVFSSFLNEKS